MPNRPFEKRKGFFSYKSYILCNLALVLLPIAILAPVFYFNTYQQVQTDVLDMRDFALLQTQQNIESTISNFGSMVLYASIDADLRPYQLKKKDYSTINALNHLRLHASSLSYFSVFFYIHAEDTFYGTDGTMSFSTFETLYSFTGEWTSGDFYQFINQPSAYASNPPGCIMTGNYQNGAEYYAILYPWTYRNIPYGTAIGLVEVSHLKERLGSGASTSGDAVLLLNHEDRILLSSGSSSYTQDFVHRALNGLDENSYEKDVVIDGQRYYVLTRASDLNGWKYVSVIPQSYITNIILNDQSVPFYILMILIVTGSALGVIMAMRYHDPVKRLETILQKSGTAPPDSPDKDGNIHERVADIINTSFSLTRELEESKQTIRQSVLSELISGSPHPDAILLKQIEALDIHLTGPFYAVLSMRFDGQTVRMQNEISKRLSQAGFHVGASFYSSFMTVLYHGKEDRRHVNSFVTRLADTIEDMGFICPVIGIGHQYATLAQLNRSFIEAVAACGEATQASQIIYFDDLPIPHAGGVDKDIFLERTRLAEALRQGNVDAADAIASDLCRQLSSMRQRADEMQYIFLRSGVLHGLMPIFEEASQPDYGWKISLLIHTSDSDEFTRQFHALCSGVARAYADKRSTWIHQRVNDITTYIDANFCRQDLSLSSIAEQFDMTASSLSRLFSESMGIRFIDYLSNKRMEYAADLLVETNESIRDIAARAGYLDASSFTRKFTKKYGQSPGHFRRNKRSDVEL